MDKFVPDMYQKNIYEIDYEGLKKRGIKCIIFDMDNTIVPPSAEVASKKLIKFIDDLYAMKFKVIIMSNNNRRRILPIKNALRVDCKANSMKPLPFSFLKIIKRYKYDRSEMIIIGDQLLTDILGGNLVGINTALVNPVSVRDDIIWTRFNRIIERFILKRLLRRDLFKKGRYYD